MTLRSFRCFLASQRLVYNNFLFYTLLISSYLVNKNWLIDWSRWPFLVFTTFWAKNRSSGKWWCIFLVFTSLHFTVVGKNFGNRAGVSNLLNHPPQSRKMVSFAESYPPMLNIDLHPCNQETNSLMSKDLYCHKKNRSKDKNNKIVMTNTSDVVF